MVLNLSLLRELTISEFKLRYHGVIFGFFWSMLKPAALLLVSYLIFSIIIPQNIPNYALFLCLGIVFWNFFLEATSISMNSILEKRMIIKSVYFDRSVLVISSCLNALMTLLIYSAIICVIIIAVGKSISFYGLLFFLLSMILLFLFVLGISFFLTAYYVEYRDITHIWQVIMHLGFWVTPVVYSSALVPKSYHLFFDMNPIARLLDLSRESLLYGRFPGFFGLSLTAFICIFVLMIGYFVYQNKSKYFAENV